MIMRKRKQIERKWETTSKMQVAKYCEIEVSLLYTRQNTISSHTLCNYLLGLSSGCSAAVLPKDGPRRWLQWVWEETVFFVLKAYLHFITPSWEKAKRYSQTGKSVAAVTSHSPALTSYLCTIHTPCYLRCSVPKHFNSRPLTPNPQP